MFLGLALNRNKSKTNIEKNEGIDECTRQIIAANMTMLVSISNSIYEIKQIELERKQQFEELKAMIKKED